MYTFKNLCDDVQGLIDEGYPVDYFLNEMARSHDISWDDVRTIHKMIIDGCFTRKVRQMKRHIYKGYVIDTDNLGRQYIYNTASPYSEDIDKKIIGVGLKYAELKAIVDDEIAKSEANVW